MTRTLALLLTLALTGALTGCSGDSSHAYVAIGDSYTAAPYIGRMDGADGCFRSTNNYPHLVAKALDLDLADESCSAATSEALNAEQRTPQGAELPPQLDAVEEDTQLVTVRIGANDFNLIGRVILSCVQLAATNPNGAPCTDTDAAAGDDKASVRIADVEKRLVAVFLAIQEKAPDAQVVAIGYPKIFPTPDEGGCAELPIAAGDLTWAHDINVGIDAAIKSAASTADVDFIDVFPKTTDHDICGDDPWIAGATVPADRKGLAYHPYAEEADLVADLLEDHLD